MKQRNLVAKYAKQFNKASVIPNKTQVYTRKNKHKHKIIE